MPCLEKGRKKKKEEKRDYVAKVRVSLVRENTRNEPITINSQYDAANLKFIKREFEGSDREKFICLHLTVKHTVISYEVVSIGSLNSAVVRPAEVFKGTLLANAAAIIVFHNHPSSGDPEPSPEDIAVTKRLVDAGKLLGIDTLDHIIYGDTGFVSLKERGVM